MKTLSHLYSFLKSKLCGSYTRMILSGATVLIVGTAIFFAPGILGLRKKTAPPFAFAVKEPPYYHKIMEIIRPLNYSLFSIIQKPGVALSVDFKNRTWTLHNIRHYAPNGTLLLDEGRNGLCAELAYYTFLKIKPFLSKPWEIKFARATEPNFFSAIKSNHVVLILGNSATQATYLLDPSFHNYGGTSEFPQYTVLGAKDDLPSLQRKDPDATLDVDGSFPLLIRNDFLILLSVESVSGFADPENHMIAISFRRRYETPDNYLLVLCKQGSQTKWLENEEALKKLLAPKEIEMIRKKFVEWMDNLSQNPDAVHVAPVHERAL